MTWRGARAGPVRPVRRRVILTVLVLVVVGLVLVIEGAELLRHPHPGTAEELTGEPDADPRVAVDCPTTVERESLVTSNDLLDCPDNYDGLRVRYQGEVVGGVLRRDTGAWVQLNDDVYAGVVGPLPAHRDYQGGNAGVGVRIPLELADAIGRPGGPRDHGDLLEVTGTFYRVAPGYGEAAVILADDGAVVRPGRPITDPVLPGRAAAAVLLAIGAAALMAADRVLARRRRWR